MSEQDFKDRYVCTFLATYAAMHYDNACAMGQHDRLEKHHALEDAIHLSERAWEQVKPNEEVSDGKHSELLGQIEDMARQHCFTKTEQTYCGFTGVNVTDSGGLSANSDALRTLAEHGRFRIVRACGRMVVGFWPEDDPANRTGSEAGR